MLILEGLASGGEESRQMMTEIGIPVGSDPIGAIAQMPKDAREQMTETLEEKFDEMPDSLVTQAAVAYVQAEYKAMGEDIDKIQMKLHIGQAGLRMILMALLIMAASISLVSCLQR